MTWSCKMSDDITPASSKSGDMWGNKMKFLCSHGGKILPRPSDGQLRYVGGETRLVTIDRSITFQDFMKKLEDIFETRNLIMKYQLPSLDLDILISVICDEDLQNMMEEYDRYESRREGSSPRPRLKAFLFPQKPPLSAVENQMSPWQRYVDAVNGLAPVSVRQKTPSSPLLRLPEYVSDSESNGPTEIDCQSPMAPCADDSPSASCPSSPYEKLIRRVPSEGAVNNSPSKRRIDLHRVHSSPNLIRPYHTHIVPVSVYNIVPNRKVYFMGSNCHGRPAVIHRRGGGSTAEGSSLQLAGPHAVPKVKSVIYAPNRTGSPLRYMTDHFKANKP